MKKNDDFSKLFFYLLCIPVIIFSCLTKIVQLVLSLINKHYYKIDLEIAKIDEMDGLEFEIFTSELLQKLNFKSVTMTKASGDFGVDVIAYKDNCKFVIQCKRYNAAVGVKAIQETISGQKFYKAHKSIVVTNSIFTKNARLMATECNVELWDRTKLLKLVKQISSPSTNTKRSAYNKYNQLNQDKYDIQTDISESSTKTNVNKAVALQRTRNLSSILYQVESIRSRKILNQDPSHENGTKCMQSKKSSQGNVDQAFKSVDYLKMIINILFYILGTFLIVLGFFTLFIYFGTGLFTIISGLVSIPIVINKIKFIQNLSYGKLVVSKIILVVLFFLTAVSLVPDK